MLQTLYISLFIVSVINLIVLIKLLKKEASSFYVILFCAVIIENLGYAQLCYARDLQGALFANQVVYMGGCYIPLFSVICISDLCKEKLPKIFTISSFLILSFIFFCVSTVEHNQLYYKSINLVVTSQNVYFEKDYGPMHILYPLYLIAIIVYGSWIVLKSYWKKRKVSYITSIVLTVAMTSTAVVYFLERILKLKIELLPLSFILLQFALLVLLERIRRYDLKTISAEAISESRDYGFVIFSSSGKLLCLDDVAREWFPELNNLYIDYAIKDTSTDFLQLINHWINNEKTDAINYFEREGKIIEVKRTVLKSKLNHSIYCINLRDDTQQQQYAKLMKNYNQTLSQQVKTKTAQLSKVQNDIILSMASIVENRDGNTGGHIKRTSDIMKIFVNYLVTETKLRPLTPEIAECIIKAAPLHDFGKIAIPDVILNKPGKFEPEEYEIMKLHSGKGAVIVSEILQNSDDVQFRTIAVNIAHFHHERYDGTGYPMGLSERQIPLEARIMALADVFDALVSKRVYKEEFSYDKAFNIIIDSCGTHFDPQLCREFVKCRPQLEALYNSYID